MRGPTAPVEPNTDTQPLHHLQCLTASGPRPREGPHRPTAPTQHPGGADSTTQTHTPQDRWTTRRPPTTPIRQTDCKLHVTLLPTPTPEKSYPYITANKLPPTGTLEGTTQAPPTGKEQRATRVALPYTLTLAAPTPINQSLQPLSPSSTPTAHNSLPPN